VRILQAIQELQTGGAERVVAALVEGGREAGHDVAVAAAPGPLGAELRLDPYPLPLLRRRLFGLPGLSRALAQAVRGFRPDVIHGHNPGIGAAAALVSRRGRRLSAIVSMHGVPEKDYRRAANLLRLAGLPVIACGPGVAAALREQGCPVAGTIVNGVGAPPEPLDRALVERDWAIAPDTPMLIAVGRLVEQKNHALAIEALSRVPDAKLAIIGEGPLRSELEREAVEVGVGDRVILAGARSDARALIGAADVLVLPSRWEGLPLVALEALAAGTPVVATAVRGTRELLTHEQNCLLVPDDDTASLAHSLNRLLTDPDLRASLTAAGKRLAASYSEEAMVTRFLHLYEALAAKPARAGRL
jgi:glycosyltransferase involved in cell wall biosynthesis